MCNAYYVIFSLYFGNISCSTSENMLPKAILKYNVSMLILPSRVSRNPFLNNKRATNSLSQPNINRKCQKYISNRIYPCQRSFVKFLFIVYKNVEWCYFVIRIGSPVLISFYCVCCFFLFLSFFYFFSGVYNLLRFVAKFVNTSNKAVVLFLVS